MDGEDVTAVLKRKAEISRMNKTLAVLLGLATAVCPAAASYYAYRQAKIESTAKTDENHREAAIGYRTLADPVEMTLTLYKAQDARIATLETEMRECQAKQSLVPPPPPSPALVPLDTLRLLKPLPKTLGEAAALAR